MEQGNSAISVSPNLYYYDCVSGQVFFVDGHAPIHFGGPTLPPGFPMGAPNGCFMGSPMITYPVPSQPPPQTPIQFIRPPRQTLIQYTRPPQPLPPPPAQPQTALQPPPQSSSNGQPTEVQRNIKCKFNRGGCNLLFETTEECKFHSKFCDFGMFLRCPNKPCCDELMLFNNPTKLLEHLTTTHGLITDTSYNGRETEVTLSYDFLFPGPAGSSVLFLRKYDMSIDDKTVVIAILLIVKEEAVSGVSVPKLTLLPIQLNQRNEVNDHLVEIIVDVSGTDDLPIEPMIDPSDLNDSYNKRLLCCRSAKDYFRQYRFGKRFSLSSTEIWEKGFRNHSRNTVKINIKIITKLYRVVVKGDLHSQLRKYMLSWNEMGLQDGIRETTDEADFAIPDRMNRIIFPQFSHGLDVMVEGKDEDGVMNSIMTSVLVRIKTNASQETHGGPTPCRAMVIFPTTTYLHHASTEWTKRAGKLRLTYLLLPKDNLETKAFIKIHGGDLAFCTLSALDSIVSGNDDEIWKILTSELLNIHFHYPSMLIDDQGLPILTKFAEKLGPKVSCIQQSCFDHFMTRLVTDVLQTSFFPKGKLMISLGSQPAKFINHNIIIKSGCCHAPCKAAFVASFIANDEKRPRRWIVSVNSTEDDHLEPILSALRTVNLGKQISVFKDEDSVINNPNFFVPFMTYSNGVIVAPRTILHFVQSDLADGIILFDYPMHAADALRYALRAKNHQSSGSRVPVIGLSKHEKKDSPDETDLVFYSCLYDNNQSN